MYFEVVILKCTTIIGNEHEEEVYIYSKERSSLVIEIERLVESNNHTIRGVNDEERIIVNPLDVCCFVSDNNKVFALIDDNKYQVKDKLYQLVESLNDNFIKINQSCIANIKKMDRFKTSIGGAVLVVFENGYEDYISRRELKKVKERLGL